MPPTYKHSWPPCTPSGLIPTTPPTGVALRSDAADMPGMLNVASDCPCQPPPPDCCTTPSAPCCGSSGTSDPGTPPGLGPMNQTRFWA